MHHVQRIGYISQKPANPCRDFIRSLSRSPKTDYQREYNGKAYSIIQAIHP